MEHVIRMKKTEVRGCNGRRFNYISVHTKSEKLVLADSMQSNKLHNNNCSHRLELRSQFICVQHPPRNRSYFRHYGRLHHVTNYTVSVKILTFCVLHSLALVRIQKLASLRLGEIDLSGDCCLLVPDIQQSSNNPFHNISRFFVQC